MAMGLERNDCHPLFCMSHAARQIAALTEAVLDEHYPTGWGKTAFTRYVSPVVSRGVV
jgi:hypothetical protein